MHGNHKSSTSANFPNMALTPPVILVTVIRFRCRGEAISGGGWGCTFVEDDGATHEDVEVLRELPGEEDGVPLEHHDRLQQLHQRPQPRYAAVPKCLAVLHTHRHLCDYALWSSGSAAASSRPDGALADG